MGHNPVVIVDDHALLSLGLQSRLESVGIESVIAELAPAAELVEWINSQEADLVVLDLGLPYDGGGASLVGPIVSSGTAVLVLTGESTSDTWGYCLQAGALDVVSKGESLDSIVESIERACAGLGTDAQRRHRLVEDSQRNRQNQQQLLEPFAELTSRETVILRGLVEGHSLGKLATRDFVSVETVRTQVKSILRKLGANSQLEAVALAHQANWFWHGEAATANEEASDE